MIHGSGAALPWHGGDPNFIMGDLWNRAGAKNVNVIQAKTDWLSSFMVACMLACLLA